MGLTIQTDPTPETPAPAPDVVPVDPDRPPVVSATATHIVVGNGVGTWQRGDRIAASDVPSVDDTTGAKSIARLVALKAIRQLSPEELAQNPAPPAKAKGDK